MGQRVFINVGNGARRPRTKRELAEAVTADPAGVVLDGKGQITRPDTWFGNTKGRSAYTVEITEDGWSATLKVRFNPQFLAVVK